MSDTTTPTPAPAPAATPAPEPTQPAGGEPIRLPDDHPLVTAFNAQKAELTQFREERKAAEDAAKTDAEKQADALAALQRENESLRSTALRAEIAAAKGVPATLLAGATKEELEASADALLAFKGTAPQQLPGNKRTPGPVGEVRRPEETREDRRKRLADSLKR